MSMVKIILGRITSIFLLLLLFLTSLYCQTNSETFPVSEYLDTITFTLDKYAHLEPIRHEQNGELAEWENYYFAREDCRCLFNGEYFVSVKEKYQDSRNLMISLQGGGASWPGLEESKEEVGEDDVYVAGFTGSLAEKLGDKWNEVIYPYCDGSVYMGDNSADYDNDGYVDHWHWGFRASSAGVALTLAKFPELDKILITGCSAGGYGSLFVTRLIRNAYPEAKIYVLNESGPGLFNPDDDETWNTIKDAWKLDQIIPGDCEPCDGQLLYLYDKLLEDDPNLKIGLYSSYQDFVLYDEYLAMTPADFESLLVMSTNYLHEKYLKQFNRFIIAGDSHCVEDRDYRINHVSYWEWILQFMTDDSSWSDLLE